MTTDDAEFTINTDGGSRGNPGPAAGAFVVIKNKTEIFSANKYYGIKTNNEAEYLALIDALEWINSHLENTQKNKVYVNMDSQLVINQINGIYKIKNHNLLTLFLIVKKLLTKINGNIKFCFVRREYNKLADKLVNEALNEN